MAELLGARYLAKEYIRDIVRDPSKDPDSLEKHTQQPLLAYLHDCHSINASEAEEQKDKKRVS